jgi:hypothetical protein
MSNRAELIEHLDHLMQLVRDDFIVGLTTIVSCDNDRVIGNGVGEPLPAQGILLMEDMLAEAKENFIESADNPPRRLRSLGPEGGYIVEDDEDDEDEEEEEDDDLVDLNDEEE